MLGLCNSQRQVERYRLFVLKVPLNTNQPSRLSSMYAVCDVCEHITHCIHRRQFFYLIFLSHALHAHSTVY